MNEHIMIWFLRKLRQHHLSGEAAGLWLDLYAYAQQKNRAFLLQIPVACLSVICDLKGDALRAACQELMDASMLKLILVEKELYCMLTAEWVYQNSNIPRKQMGEGRRITGKQ